MLFVDDDALILAGVEAALHRAAADWDARFVLGGEAALEAIANEPFDVIVSDLSMPGVDGIAVLERAREQQPDAARIIVSGGAGAGTTLAASRVAHRYLAKPCRSGDLHAAIERACDLRQLLREEGWRRAAGGVIALPSCPHLYLELTELTLDADATSAAAAALIERDVAMSAKVLKLVNSAFFGLGRRIARVAEAVHYLGLETLRALVLHAGAFEAFAPRRPIDGFDITALEGRSQLAGRIARRLAPADMREDAFTAALLTSVGLLALAREEPHELADEIAEAHRRDIALHEVEYARHGSSHAELGAYVLGMWGLPDTIVEAVAHQHRADDLAGGAALDMALVVHAAGALAAELRPGALATRPVSLDHATLGVVGADSAHWRALAMAEAAAA